MHAMKNHLWKIAIVILANNFLALIYIFFLNKALAYSNLACIHNIHVMHTVCAKMREIMLKQG